MPVKIDSKIIKASIVKDTDKPKEEVKPIVVKKEKRPPVLTGETHKLTNHAKGYNLYLTVNYLEDKPFEVFIDGSHTDATQWVKGLARLISAMLRSHDNSFNLEFVAKELMKISSDEGYHAGGKNGYVSGIVQHIGKTMLKIHKDKANKEESIKAVTETKPEPIINPGIQYLPDACPECGDNTMVLKDGCPTCDCGYSKCS